MRGAVKEDSGKTLYYEGILEDINSRKMTEEALKKSEQLLDSIVDNVPDIIYRLDTSSKIMFVSDAVKKYGYTPEELIGKDIFEIIHPNDRDKAAKRINERRTGDRRTKALELHLLTKEQLEIPF